AAFPIVIPGRRPQRGAARREGKGTQVPNTVTVSDIWVPFPHARSRSHSPGMTSGVSSLLERNLLDVPQRASALVEHVIALGMQRVDQTSGLALPQAGLRPAQQLAVMIHAIDLAGAVAAIEIFGRELHRPRLADAGNVFLEVQ